MTKFCSYFVEHRETSELGSGIIPARPSCPFHLLVVSLSPSWRYRLGVALSIDIPYLRALFVALSLMVQVVASLLFFCLFVFLSFLSFSLLFIGKWFSLGFCFCVRTSGLEPIFFTTLCCVSSSVTFFSCTFKASIDFHSD